MAQDNNGAVTIVTQTRPVSGEEGTFTRWQDQIGAEVAGWPGFLDQKIIQPTPPGQVDWCILQRFSSLAAATAWLHSSQRLALVDAIQPVLSGSDDIHIVQDGSSGVLPAPVSIVISTRVKAGHEVDYRRWEQRIAAVQSQAPGFQGYRFEPPVPGVQDDWLGIIRFDSDENLQNWMNSPERLKLLESAAAFTERVNTRVVRSGFDQWFSDSAKGSPTPVWKMNMIVLSMLYPTVFLFGLLVQGPVLMKRLQTPFWLALFIGNLTGVVLLNWLVPWASRRFTWWLQPANSSTKTNILGVGAVVGLYGFWMLLFSRL